MKKFIVFGVLAFLMVLNSACGPRRPVQPTPTPRVVPGITIDVDLPLDGSVVSLGPVPITGYVHSIRCCVTGMRIFVNGRSIGARTATGSLSTYSQTFSWTPPAAGEYYLQAQATYSNGDIALSQASRICVLGGMTGRPSLGGYLGPCQIPTRVPSASSNGTILINAMVSPQSVIIMPTCTNGVYPTFTINAAITDPADQVFMVTGALSINDSSSIIHYLNWFTTNADSVKQFRGTFTPPSSLTSIGSLSWNVAAFDRNNQYLGGWPLQSINVFHADCQHQESGSAVPLQIIPSATPSNPIAGVQAYPSPIYYGDTCPSLSNLSFRAALLLPNGASADQYQVTAHVSLVGSDGNLTVPLTPNGTFDTASGGSVFLGSLDLSHSYKDQNNQFDPAVLDGSNGSLQWYITAANQNTELGRSAEQILKLAPCPTYSQPTSQPSSGTSGGNTCNKTQAYCSQFNEKLDTATCTCVP